VIELALKKIPIGKIGGYIGRNQMSNNDYLKIKKIDFILSPPSTILKR
jgi:hypothetical protein